MAARSAPRKGAIFVDRDARPFRTPVGVNVYRQGAPARRAPRRGDLSVVTMRYKVLNSVGVTSLHLESTFFEGSPLRCYGWLCHWLLQTGHPYGIAGMSLLFMIDRAQQVSKLERSYGGRAVAPLVL